MGVEGSSLIRTFAADIVVCLSCGTRSDVIGDRWREFIVPHYKGPCGAGYENMDGLFEWRPITDDEARRAGEEARAKSAQKKKDHQGETNGARKQKPPRFGEKLDDVPGGEE